ncbi:MAG: hypothetical protein RBT60_12725 [Candidatus Krumholzibacteria bacterium]|jgi:hypothetical protein|nr:hypothetical protein [Candidatus Krumholzibacteria bacterium]
MTARGVAHHRARLLAGLLILLAAHLLLRGYVTDDTYIHLRYAENLATRGEFAFNPGEKTYGATSPLWIFGLVALRAIGLSGPGAAWALGLLAGALTLALFAGIVRRLAFSESWRWGLFLLAAVDAWFLRWTMSGMETPLATASLLVLLWPLVMASPVAVEPGQSRPLWPRYFAWGVAAGLAGLVRPEFLVLAPCALPWLLLAEYREGDLVAGPPGRYQARPHRPLLAAAAGWLLSAGPWLLYAHRTFGRLTPGTIAAKSNDPGATLGELAGYLFRSLQQLGMVQSVVWIAFAVLAVYVLVERLRQERQDIEPTAALADSTWRFWPAVALVLIAATWSAVLLGGYAVKRVWTISRYLCPLSPVLLLVIGVLAYWLLHFADDFRGRDLWRRRLVPAICGLSLLANAALTVGLVRPHARDFSAGVVACYLEKGAWIGEHSPPDAVIAALDIGAVAYGSDRKVLDLMGLVSPEITVLGRRVGFQEMVEQALWLHADSRSGPLPAWFVDRSDGPPRWADQVRHGVRFDLVDTCEIRGLGLRERQPWTVAIYRLRPEPVRQE